MKRTWIGAVVISMLGLPMPVHAAGDEYRLTGCSVREGTIHLGFANQWKAVRRMSIGPRGVTLGGDLKGDASLKSVKQFRFTRTGVLVYEPNHGPAYAFGPLGSECRAKFQEVVAPLANIKEGDG